MELAQKTGLAKNTLTAMLGRMEQNGLISWKASPLDKRQSLILLTPKARALEQHYHQVSRQMDDLFFRDFKKEEITCIRAAAAAGRLLWVHLRKDRARQDETAAERGMGRADERARLTMRNYSFIY